MHRVLSSQLALRGEVLSRGSSASAARLRSALARVAGTPGTTILLEGERGTRRDAFAAYVHSLSERAAEPAVLHTAGGDGDFARGLTLAAEAAGAGTLVLEGPERLTPSDQELLSHVLGRRTLPKEYGEGPPFEGRLIALTDAGFDEAVERGAVVEELAYRLNVLRIELPPLRLRLEDAPELLAGLAELEGAPNRPQRPDPAAFPGALADHRWPGNLRELEAAWALASARAGDRRVAPDDLIPGATEPAPSHGDALRSVEEAWIRRILAREDGNRSRAARVLGIHRATLHKKLREYAIDA